MPGDSVEVTGLFVYQCKRGGELFKIHCRFGGSARLSSVLLGSTVLTPHDAVVSPLTHTLTHTRRRTCR